MRVAIDIRPLLEAERSGVATYTSHLLTALCQRENNDYALFCNARNRALPSDIPKESNRVSHAFTRYPNKLLNLSFAAGYPLIENLVGGADITYLPNINFIATKKPLVVTVHDLSFIRYPQFFSVKQRLWHAAIRPKLLLSKAAAVIAVSEHTKEDIMETYGLPGEKIHVVNPAASPGLEPASQEQQKKVREHYKLPESYFLALSALEPRKNLLSIIHAFEKLPEDTHLAIAGGSGWLNKELFAAASSSPTRERITFLGHIPEYDKAALYSGAMAFVYPSFYEGFGIPPLEAMTCGTPVITSLGSSLGEVVGDAGVLIDPYKPDELHDAMQSMLTDESLRAELIARGKKQASTFTWDKSASRLEDVFSSLR